MKKFLKELNLQSKALRDRTWFFLPYDQLNSGFGPAAKLPPTAVGMVFVESLWKPNQRPYHKQKLALILANQRHFALEQAKRGVAIRYLVGPKDYAALLRQVCLELGPITMMRPSERELRQCLGPLVREGLINEVENECWLTTGDDFKLSVQGKRKWRLDAFYRYVRTKYNILLDSEGKPEGGRWSFDSENRKPWKGKPQDPNLPTFQPDSITQEVIDWKCSFHPKKNCPMTRMYWNFLTRKEPALKTNLRMRIPLAAARKRPNDQKLLDQSIHDYLWMRLKAGKTIEVDEVERTLVPNKPSSALAR